MNDFSASLHISPDLWAQMEVDVEAKAPEEACGILAGIGNQSRLVIPITNILHSPFRFRMEPKEQLDAFLLAENKGLEILAVYHSHPHGISEPSETDHEELTYPGIIYLIWYKVTSEWQCRGFLMSTRNHADEVSLVISSI